MGAERGWVRIASGDYESPDGRYRIYRIPDLRPPAWNVEAVWTRDEWDRSVPYRVRSELVVDGAASLRDAKGIFEQEIQRYEKERDEMNGKIKPEPGKVCVVPKIPECNFCQDGTPGPYDFATRMGPWANGCERHWKEFRVGPLGVGSGQFWITQDQAKEA